MYNSLSKKKWKGYEWISKTGKISNKSTTIIENKNYIPKKERPKWCVNKNKKRLPQFKCLCYGKNEKRCPFFAFCDARKKDYLFLNKMYEED